MRLKPLVSVTCQHGCSQISQPRNVPNENILFELLSFTGRDQI